MGHGQSHKRLEGLGGVLCVYKIGLSRKRERERERERGGGGRQRRLSQWVRGDCHSKKKKKKKGGGGVEGEETFMCGCLG